MHVFKHFMHMHLQLWHSTEDSSGYVRHIVIIKIECVLHNCNKMESIYIQARILHEKQANCILFK